MNHRERFVAIFEGRPVDHLPWLPDLTYWSEARRRRGRLPARYEGRDGGHHLCADFGACVYYGHSDSPALARMEGVTTTTQEHGDIIIDRVECEGHSLERHKRWMPGSCCYGIEKYYVTDVSQLAVVREIFRRRQYVPNPNANGPTNKLGDDGHPITSMPRSPLPALMVDWLGVMGTIFMMADEREEVEKTLEVIDRANDGFFGFLASSSARICHFCDNLTADTIGGYWNRYCAEYYSRRVSQVHDAGKYCVTHLDGSTRALIPKLMDAGLDGIESLTPKPVGDITMEEMSRLMGPGEEVFWGGLPGAMFVAPFVWDDLRRMVDGLFKLHRSGRRVVVGTADQVPPDADIENIRRVADYLEELGA